MFWRVRSYWMATGAACYVAFAALRAHEGHGAALLALLAVPVALAVGWTLTDTPTRGEDRIDGAARASARACMAGAAMLLAALGGPDTPAFVALANLGAAVASMASLVSLARLTSLGGLLEPPANARRLDAVAFASLFWTVAVALPAARALDTPRFGELDPTLIDYATTAASVASLGLGIAVSLQVRSARRLELGVADRASAALLLAATALLTGLLAAAVGVAAPERMLPFTAVVASLAIVVAGVTQEATALSRALRSTLSLAALALPVAMAAVAVAHVRPARGAAVAFVASLAAALAGLASVRVARLLGPSQSKALEALEEATRAALTPDPDAALESALVALKRITPMSDGTGAALYRLAPPEVVTVDRAGYVHVQKAELPARLLDFADAEPERILRTEVARAVEVRRVELRPIGAWLEQRGFAAVAIVRDDLGPVGLLALPRGSRRSPMALEEVRSLRMLADRLGAVIGVSAALARSRDRENAARLAVERAASEANRLGTARARDEDRLQAIARMLERPARIAAYSPAARFATDQIELYAGSGHPVTLLSAPGVDATAWAALAHLASPRRRGPLALVDATSLDEHALTRWRDPVESPLVAARGGSLALIDVHALPPDVQSYIGSALQDDTGLIVSAPSTVDSLVASRRMHERLADRLGDRAVALPTLVNRSEDLRALAIEHLGRIGVRLQSRPLGLDGRALEALLAYGWPGNDAELAATLLRAALVAEGEVIGVRELGKIGFHVEGAREEGAMTNKKKRPGTGTGRG